MAVRFEIVTWQNTDFPSEYPWRWSAALDQIDSFGRGSIAFADGDTEDEAVAQLRADERSARRAPIDRIDPQEGR